MLTGSTAANFYAVPRMTRDIDIVLEIKREDSHALVKLFEDDFYIDEETVLEAIEKNSMFNALHNDYVVKVDFIVRKPGEYRRLEFERRRLVDFAGQSIWVVSPEDLVLSKLYWAKDTFSDMQLGDVRNIISQLKDMDFSYIEKWVQELGIEEVYRRIGE